MVRHASGAGVLLVLALLPLSAQIPGGRTLEVRPADARYLRETNRIYALLSATSPQYPQSVVEIDPDNLNVLRSVPLPEPGDLLEMTDDGGYLYAIARATAPSTVYRIDIGAMTIEARYRPVFSDSCSSCRIASLLALPKQPQSFAVSFTDQWGTYVGTAAFDRERRRPKVLVTQMSELLATSTPDLIYGYDGLGSSFGITRIRIVDDGLENCGSVAGAASGFNRTLQVFHGLLYGANGTVSNVETGTREGWFRSSEVAFAQAFAIDDVNGRIYFSNRSGFGTSYLGYDLNTFLPVSRLRVEDAQAGAFEMPAAARRLLLTSAGDLVVFDGTSSRLLFIPTAALPSYLPWTPPIAEQITPHLRRLRIPASYLAADPVNRKVLVTLQGRVPGTGNSLLTIDPVSGTVVSGVFAGAEPGPPAVSSGGAYVYVPLYGHGAVRRFRAADMQADLTVRLSTVSSKSSPGGSITQAAQVLPLPYGDDSYAVIQVEAPETDLPNFDSLVVYDGAIRRLKSVNQDQTRINSGAVGDDGGMLFGLNGESSGFDFSRVRLSPEGAVLEATVVGLGDNFLETLACDGTLCATTEGTVLDPLSGMRTARLRAVGPVLPDRGFGRVYVMISRRDTTELREYDADAARLLRTASFPVSGPVYNLCRWADNEFAALTAEGVLLIAGDALTPVPPPSAAPPVVAGGVGKLGVSFASVVFDPKRNLLYAAVPGTSSAYANEVVAIDPASGKIMKDVPAGSDPSLLRITEDGRYLYAALTTGYAVARFDLDSWQRDALYRVPGSPNVLALRPGHSDTFIAALGSGPVFNSGGVPEAKKGLWVYRNGVPLPSATPENPTWALPVDADTVLTGDARLRLTEAGVSVDKKITDRFLNARGQVIAGGPVFGAGSIGDTSTLRLKEQLDEYGAPLPDPDRGLIYYLRSDGIRVYAWETLRVVGFLPFDFGTLVNTTGDLVPCGKDCIAVLIRDTLYLVDLRRIQWYLPAPEKPVNRSVDGVQRIAIRSAAMQYDARRARLYVATPPEEGGYGNSVLVIDPVSGKIEETLFAGTAPSALTISGDGSRLYVGLRGSRGVATVDLNTRQVISRLALPPPFASDYWPMGIAVLPGTNDVLGISASGSSGWSDWRQVILDPGGKMRPQWVGGQATQRAQGSGIFFTGDGKRLLGFNGTISGAPARWSFPVGPDGIQYSPPQAGELERTIAFCSGAIFGSSGAVYNSETLASVRSILLPETDLWQPPDQAVTCDSDRNRLYYLRHYRKAESGQVVDKTVLHAFALSTLELIASRELPSRDGFVTQMVAIGDAGVAYWISARPFLDTSLQFPSSAPDELFIVSAP